MLRSYSSREVIRILRSHGWYEAACIGDHHQFKRPVRKGRVTVTHPVKDMHTNDLKSIEAQAGIRLEG